MVVMRKSAVRLSQQVEQAAEGRWNQRQRESATGR
jgi:hypothetical protein